ncbi:hypothetical protein EVAR_53839_1 [Eumeta japonica]|uniref:Uncharacterized protein n=1 Tax=Eumeta variegata TaxID=151549 RepID=A0A4C1ZIP4_EUMVA|nr:hypothetical protein EVAR_53839_1 [Eumeta japonica]
MPVCVICKTVQALFRKTVSREGCRFLGLNGGRVTVTKFFTAIDATALEFYKFVTNSRLEWFLITITSSKPSEREVVRPGCERSVLHQFIALTSATLKVYTCEGILRKYLNTSEARLTAALEDAEATACNNNSQTILRGSVSRIHIATYSAICGLVALEEEQT